MGFSVNTKNGVIQITDRYGDDSIPSNRVEVRTESVYGQIDAFRKSSVVQSAITRRANAFGNLNIWAKDDRGRKVQNATVKADLAMLKMFNPYQSFQVFNNQVEAYCGIFGECFVYKSPIVGFKDFDCYIIPNHLISTVYAYGSDQMFKTNIAYFNIAVNGGILRLETDEVIVINDNCYNFTPYGIGESRLVGLKEPISTLLSIGETRTQLVADGGARGIIGQGAKDIDMLSAPFLENEKSDIQKKLKQYGGLRNQFKYIVTKGAVNYVPLTSRIVDMDLTGGALDATIQIFDRYGIPAAFAAKEPRFKVLPEARKEFYTATIIPEATIRFKDLCDLKGIPERDWEYKPDWAHMDFFQESLVQSGTAIQQVMNAITPAREKGFISQDQFDSILEPYLE